MVSDHAQRLMAMQSDAMRNNMKILAILSFLDGDRASKPLEELQHAQHKSSWSRWIPFVVLHAPFLMLFAVGWSWQAVALCVVLYLIRMFAITGFYHRYFSHRTFKTSRVLQFIFGVIGATSVQRGPLWWAAHHRGHHRYSDKELDVHSPVVSGLVWSHIGWITSDKNIPTDYSRVPDLAKFPELVFLNRFDWLPVVILAVSVFAYGQYLHGFDSRVTGAQLLVWGFVSTIILFHATCSINSFGHLIGSRRFDTDDDSRNNPVLALFTLGEGWHNNHHRFPGSTKQGIMWWEFDATYEVLKLMQSVGLVWEISKANYDPSACSASDDGVSRRPLLSQDSEVGVPLRHQLSQDGGAVLARSHPVELSSVQFNSQMEAGARSGYGDV
ncbi:MAG: fatty acid desaturase [Candidatus Melainabacteria bacterium]|nr:fatty acid desaturase [Candidatus Melainabacteria bacterium]